MVKNQFGNQYCSRFLNLTRVHELFENKCVNRSSCHFPFKESGVAERANRLDPTFFLDMLGHPECIDSRSDIFIQYSCQDTVGNSYQKFNRLSIVACLSCFISLVYSLTIYYLKQKAYIDIKKFDLRTVTAGDYTVFLGLDNEQVQRFLTDKKYQKFLKNKGGAFGLGLQEYL